ncbi:unnamed protein product [Lathyrus oleraceus]
MKILFIVLLIFSIHLGNEVRMLEADDCTRIIPGYCKEKWKSFFCSLNCMGECNTFAANGKCHSEDNDCHCNCCS